MSERFFVKRYKKLKPDFEVCECEIRKSLRVNTLKISEKELISRLKKEKIELKKINGLEYGYNFSANFSLGSTPEYLQGYYYLQETASQFVAEKLLPTESDIVLDMCAAPGSKTTHLAQLMNNKGTIIALDNVNWRLCALRNNIERCGVKNTIVYNKDARFVFDFKQKFDKILLDAPCSGNYTLEKDWFDKRSMDDIKNNAKVQRQLFRAAISVLKNNATMIYSTCSLEIEENEDIINWAKEEFDIEILSQKRYWPDKEGTQGFFITHLKKLSDD